MLFSPLLDRPVIVPGLPLAIPTADCVPVRVSQQPDCTMCESDADGRWTYRSQRRDRATRTPKVDVQWSIIAMNDA